MRRLSIIFLGVIFLSNIPSLYYSLYIQYPWVDVVQHFSGGFFVAMFMAAYLKDRLAREGWLKNLIIIAGATVFIGVLWEFSEYIANQTLVDYFYEKFQLRVYFMGDLKDTIGDLSMDISGAVLLYFLHLLRSRNAHEIKRELQDGGGSLAQ